MNDRDKNMDPEKQMDDDAAEEESVTDADASTGTAGDVHDNM